MLYNTFSAVSVSDLFILSCLPTLAAALYCAGLLHIQVTTCLFSLSCHNRPQSLNRTLMPGSVVYTAMLRGRKLNPLVRPMDIPD